MTTPAQPDLARWSAAAEGQFFERKPAGLDFVRWEGTERKTGAELNIAKHLLNLKELRLLIGNTANQETIEMRPARRAYLKMTPSSAMVWLSGVRTAAHAKGRYSAATVRMNVRGHMRMASKRKHHEGYFARRSLFRLAVWEAAGFLLLILFIWADYAYGILSFAAGRLESHRWMGALALTAVASLVGFITVANTYLQHKRELCGLLAICSYCHKVRINQEAWAQIEYFLTQKTRATFTHVICPECEPKVLAEMIAADSGQAD